MTRLSKGLSAIGKNNLLPIKINDLHGESENYSIPWVVIRKQ